MDLGILFLGIGSTLEDQMTVARQAEDSGFAPLMQLAKGSE